MTYFRTLYNHLLQNYLFKMAADIFLILLMKLIAKKSKGERMLKKQAREKERQKERERERKRDRDIKRNSNQVNIKLQLLK